MLAEITRDNRVTPAAVEDFFQDFDHRSPFFQANLFDIARTAALKYPAFRSEHYGGFSVVSNYALMHKISMAPAEFPNDAGAQSIPQSAMPPLIPADINPPHHAFYRSALNPLFAPSRMARLEQDVEARAVAMVTQAIEAGEAELISDLALPFTGLTSFGLFGFDPQQWRRYAMPLHNATFALGSAEDRAAELEEYGSAIAATVAELVKDPDPATVIGALALYEQNGRRISTEEINNIVNTLVIGGLGTTQAAISTATVYLARNPERRQELIDHPERIPAAVNEFLRVFTPTIFNGRMVPRDIEIDGHLFRAGETTLLFRTAANLDPTFIERPYEIDFQRQSSRMVSFGLGPHMCLGQHLARLEFTVMLRTLLRLAPDYELAEEPTLPPNFGTALAYATVPLRFSA